MHRAVRPIISLVLIVLSVLGLINVYGDHTDVEAQARELACSGCRQEPTLRQVSRTPLSHEYHLVTETSEVVVVECARSAIFVGAYSCKKE